MKKTYVQFSKRMTVVSVVSAVLIALGTEWILWQMAYPSGIVEVCKAMLMFAGLVFHISLMLYSFHPLKGVLLMPYFTDTYASPLGVITIVCDEHALLGLYFSGQEHFLAGFTGTLQKANSPIFAETKRWLDCYFSGTMPSFTPPLHVIGSPFRKTICDIMANIPYGQTITYGAIAEEATRRMAIPCMSAQAVGGAVGHNPISLIIPCHRVIGTGGNLTGYAGGIQRKISLLALEGIDVSKLHLPRKKQSNRVGGSD